MTTIEEVQEKYLKDIKEIATQISQAHSVSGLVMYQSDIQRLYDKFIFLKGLKNHSQLAVELNKTAQPKPNSKVEKVVHTLEDNNEEVAIATETDKPGIDYNFNINQSAKHNELNIDLNDSIGFLNTLFKGEKDSYTKFIEDVNNRNNVTSVSFINHTAQILEWGKTEQEFLDRLLDLNNNRFS